MVTGSLRVVFTLCLLASLLGAGGWLWQRERLRETVLYTLRQERDAAWQALAEQRQTQQVFHTLDQTVEHEKEQQCGESEKGRQQVRQRLSRVNCIREPVPGPVADRVRRDARLLTVETRLGTTPSAQTVHALKVEITELRGDLKETRASLQAVTHQLELLVEKALYRSDG